MQDGPRIQSSPCLVGGMGFFVAGSITIASMPGCRIPAEPKCAAISSISSVGLVVPAHVDSVNAYP
jgi:hypothetical protein